MSKSRSKAGRRLYGTLCTDVPDGFFRGCTYPKEGDVDISDDPTDIIPEPHYEDDDRWSRLAYAIFQIRYHPLVREFNFPPDSLLITTDSGHPAAMTDRALTVTLEACHAADELASLADDREVCKVLDWIGEPPKSLKGFGANRLFRHADALRARVEEITAERSRPKSGFRRTTGGGIRPRYSLPTHYCPNTKGKKRH